MASFASSSLRFAAPTRRLLALVAALPLTLAADEFVWSGAADPDANWSTATNWVGGIAPVGDPATTLVFTGSANLAPVADAGFSLLGLTFDGAASGFVLSGAQLTFAGSLTDDPDGSFIANDSGVTQTIGNDLFLGAYTHLKANSGDLVFSGAINVSADQATFSAGVGRTVTLNGALSDSGAPASDATLNLLGGGTFVLAGANGFAGVTRVSGAGTTLHFAADPDAYSAYYLFEDTADFTLAPGVTLQKGVFSYLGPTVANRALAVAPGVFGAETELELENITADFDQAGLITDDAFLILLGTTDLTVSAPGAVNTSALVVATGESRLDVTATGGLTTGALYVVEDATLTLGAADAVSASLLLVGNNGTAVLNGHDLTVESVLVQIDSYAPEDPEAPLVPGGIRNDSATDVTFTIAPVDPDIMPPSVIDGVLSDGAGGGKLGLTVTGNGAYAFIMRPQTYTGPTRVTAGAALVYDDCGCDPGALFSASIITVDTGGVLGGNALVGAVNVEDGGVLSPGDDTAYAIDTLRTGTVTLSGGTSLRFDLFDAAGEAGLDWDLLEITGALNFSAAVGDTLTVTVGFLDEFDEPAAALNFDPGLSYSWKLASASAGIFEFDPSMIIVTPTLFADGLPGLWTVTSDGTDLFLNYIGAAIPEPAAFATLGALGVAAFAGLRRRRRAG